MKKINIYILTFFLLAFQFTYANEPFVILEYNKFNSTGKKNLNRDNPFLRNSSYSTIHEVKDGDSLSGIINKYYSNTGLNKKIIEVSIIEINSKAFVKKNPHYLFAGSSSLKLHYSRCGLTQSVYATFLCRNASSSENQACMA